MLAKSNKERKSENKFAYFKSFLYFCGELSADSLVAMRNNIYFTDEPIIYAISLAAYKQRIRLAMRQCILWYVLLLLFYSWVMPDTLA